MGDMLPHSPSRSGLSPSPLARPDTPDLVKRLTNASRDLRRLDWRLHEVLLVPVERLSGPSPA